MGRSGRARHRQAVRALAAIVLAALVLVGSPLGVRAQEPPDGGAGEPEAVEPSADCPDGAVQAGCPDEASREDREAERELRNLLGLDEADQPHPLEAYDIGCDEGAWNHVLRKMWCAAQSLPFAIGKWAIGVGIDLMGWALEFRIARTLTPVAGALSRIYDTSLVGPLGVRQLAWVLALFVAGWHLLRARFASGARDLATTCVIAAVGGIVLANPQGYLAGSVTLAQNSSGAVLEATHDTVANGDTTGRGPDAARRQIADVLRRSFVAEPYDLIDWGEPLRGACAAARDEILEGGPWGADDEPRDIMREAGCDEQADFNHDPSDDRAAAALVVMLASIAATVLLVAIALAVFVGQLTLVAAFAAASLVWALALFPGVGRELLAWWLGRLAWAVAATVAATFVLSWVAITITAVLAATGDISIIQRCLVALLVVAFGFRLRSHLGRSLDTLTRRLGSRLGPTPSQSGAPAAAGAAAGFGLAAAARSWAVDAPGGQYMYNRLYARHFTRGYRTGIGRRTIRRASDLDRGATSGGLDVAGTVGRGVRTIALAPVVGPQALAARQARATVASRRARARLAQAQATRRQWVRNAAHPIEAVREARRQAGLAPPARQRRAEQPPRPEQPARPTRQPRPGPGPRPAARQAGQPPRWRARPGWAQSAGWRQAPTATQRPGWGQQAAWGRPPGWGPQPSPAPQPRPAPPAARRGQRPRPTPPPRSNEQPGGPAADNPQEES